MPQQKTTSHIGISEQLEAQLEQTQDLRISGKFQGSLYSTGDLFIEKTGLFIGEAHVASAYIRGQFQGNLEATHNVFLYETSFFEGILDCPQANISLGAKCSGEVRIISKTD